jgi:simple sugar transport system permease protein
MTTTGVGLSVGASPAVAPGSAPQADADRAAEVAARREARRRSLETVAVPGIAILAALVLFGIFVAFTGRNPFAVYQEMWRGSFGTWFSFQNTLQRAAPLMLTALATALPLRLGLVVLGGEGAMVLGGLAAAAVAVNLHTPNSVKVGMMLMGAVTGGAWMALAGALRAYRGVNETISTLLLNYIAIALLNHLVEGPLRDPASLNKPSTLPIGDENMMGTIPGFDVHWGLVWGVAACLILWVLMQRTTFGFAARMVGGNMRAALLNGLPVRRLIVVVTFLAGLTAGLAGAIEVAAVHGAANASLVTGYGYTGVLVAFIARANPLGAIPVAVLLGGIGASGGLLQRVFELPDATVNVLQGILFLCILLSETLYGRRWRRP